MDEMLEETVTVVHAEGGWVWVEGTGASACAACHSGDCSASTLGKLFASRRHRLRLPDSLGARPGERVVIGVPGRVLVRVSLWAYLLPLMGMLVTAAAAASLGLGEGLQVLAALAGLALGLGVSGRMRPPAAQDVRLLRRAGATTVIDWNPRQRSGTT